MTEVKAEVTAVAEWDQDMVVVAAMNMVVVADAVLLEIPIMEMVENLLTADMPVLMIVVEAGAVSLQAAMVMTILVTIGEVITMKIVTEVVMVIQMINT
jgi:hypothetical protein